MFIAKRVINQSINQINGHMVNVALNIDYVIGFEESIGAELSD